VNELLLLNSDINERNSRYGSLNLVCRRFKQESEGGRSISVRTARLWNALPKFLKKSTNVHSFKKGLIDFYASSFKDIHRFAVFFIFMPIFNS